MLARQVTIVGGHDQAECGASDECDPERLTGRHHPHTAIAQEPSANREQWPEHTAADQDERNETEEGRRGEVDADGPQHAPGRRERSGLTHPVRRHVLLVHFELAGICHASLTLR